MFDYEIILSSKNGGPESYITAKIQAGIPHHEETIHYLP